MRICYMRVIFYGPYLSHITRSACTILVNWTFFLISTKLWNLFSRIGKQVKQSFVEFTLEANLWKKITNLSDLIESAKELVESGDQFRGRQFLRQRREVHDVGVQDAAKNPEKLVSKLDRFITYNIIIFFCECYSLDIHLYVWKY